MADALLVLSEMNGYKSGRAHIKSTLTSSESVGTIAGSFLMVLISSKTLSCALSLTEPCERLKSPPVKKRRTTSIRRLLLWWRKSMLSTHTCQYPQPVLPHGYQL